MGCFEVLWSEYLIFLQNFVLWNSGYQNDDVVRHNLSKLIMNEERASYDDVSVPIKRLKRDSSPLPPSEHTQQGDLCEREGRHAPDLKADNTLALNF